MAISTLVAERRCWKKWHGDIVDDEGYGPSVKAYVVSFF